MSIIAYSGLPGSGKSYGVVENVILPALENGRTIYTNIPLKVGTLSDDYPGSKIEIFSTQDAEDQEFWNWENFKPGSIFVIDECWRYWKSGQKSTAMLQEEKQFFTEHRHYVGQDGKTSEIVLVTQDLQQVCAFVRNLVEETYRAVKLSALGMSKKYRVDVFQGGVTGQNPPNPMRQLYGKYKPEVFKYYRSHTKNKTDFAAGMEEKADDRANAWKNPIVKYGFPFAILLIIWGVMNVMSYFDRGKPDQEAQPVPVQGTLVQSNQAKPVKAVYQVPADKSPYQRYEINRKQLPLSDRYRLVGEFGDIFYIWGDSGTRQVHRRLCTTIRNTGEPACVIDGKMVTYYSYKEPHRDPDSSDYSVGDSIGEAFN